MAVLGIYGKCMTQTKSMFCTFLDAGDCPVNMACSSAEEYPKRGLYSSLAGQYPKRDNFFPKNTLIIFFFNPKQMRGLSWSLLLLQEICEKTLQS